LFLSLFNPYINITSQSSLQLIIIIIIIIIIVNLPVVRSWSCRVIYYFDTPTLGRRYQSFGRVRYTDPLLIAQIVRVMMEVMPHMPIPAPPVAPAMQVPPVAPAPMDNVVTLVRLVKSMRELGCKSFAGELDAVIVGRWLHTVEDIMEQI